ncbi:MAG: hypothetical protein HYU30_05650 [Chloroflexi bacterium]|nr:hypothetical protein [Chloroflexota bacterium]
MEKRLFPRTLDQRFFAAFLDCLGNRLEMVRSAQGWLHLEDPQFGEMVERFRRSSVGYEDLDEARKEFVALLFAAAAMAAWDAHEEYGAG